MSELGGRGSASNQSRGRAGVSSGVRQSAIRIGQGVILGLFLIRGLGCGLDTDSDHDGYWNAAALAGNVQFDCDDTDPTIKTGEAYYRDSDGDGLGDRSRACYICLSPTEPTPASAAAATTDQAAICGEAADAGVGYVHNSLDCDDADKKKGAGLYYYRDADDDGLGDPSIDLTIYFCPAGPDDKPPTGYVTNSLDCNDDDPWAGTSKGIALVYYFDSDDDGYGGLLPFQTCGAAPEKGYVLVSAENPQDCDDVDPLVHPKVNFDCGDAEHKDNDCDGTIDEDAGRSWYKDADLDGYGDSSSAAVVTCPPPEGYVGNNFDCNDADPNIYPGAGCAIN